MQKKKILMPGSTDLYIGGITVITDENGSITRINTFEAFPFDIVDPEQQIDKRNIFLMQMTAFAA